MSTVQDSPAIFWLVSKWLEAGSPLVSGEEWEEVVAEAIEKTTISQALIP